MLSNIRSAAALLLYGLATISTAQPFWNSTSGEDTEAGEDGAAAPAPMAPGPRLYFLDQRGGRVLTTKPDGTDLRVVATGFRQAPDGIAVDKKVGYIYVSNMGSAVGSSASGSIVRINLDGTGLTTIVAPGKTHTAKQLILVEQADGKKLYWGDREGLRVMRSNVDGSQLETVVDVKALPCQGGAQCRHVVGVAVDTQNGFLYWSQKGTDSGGEGSLHRVPITLKAGEAADKRSDVQTLFTKMPEPIDLHWVAELNSLYWTDRAFMKDGNSVNRAKIAAGPALPAGIRKEVLFTGLRVGIGIAVDVKSNSVWATDIGGKIMMSDLEGKNVKTIGTGLGSLVGIDYVE